MTATMRTCNIADICARKGLKHAVISPGSRSAPLTVFFARHPEIRTHVVKDERCAAYIALGIAQQTGVPAVLICTSGTAALNFTPGVAEAYYQQVSLLVLTADRPPEWIDQQDGQAVHQNRLYTEHCKGNYTLPLDTDNPDSAWHFDRIVCEAINLAEGGCKGPVHINVPIREPFYSSIRDDRSDDPARAAVKIIDEVRSFPVLQDNTWRQLAESLQRSAKPLLLVGQSGYCKKTIEQIDRFVEQTNCAVLADVLANLHGSGKVLQNVDTIIPFLDAKAQETLVPSLLITFGQSILSKNIKNLLRQGRIDEHWHIQPRGAAADTYQSLTRIIRVEPSSFLKEIADRIEKPAEATEFSAAWTAVASRSEKITRQFFKADNDFGEFHAVNIFLESIPPDCVLHLGNSMSVRYANLAGIGETTVKVYANRGTAGIDGCLSTGVGHALAGDQLHFVLLGDISFFYDRNSLWLNDVPGNLRIVLLNNHGGGIFDIIEGPNELPELEEFFLTGHSLEAGFTAQEMGLEYFLCSDKESLRHSLTSFYRDDGRAKILEIKTRQQDNTAVFNAYRALFNKASVKDR